MWSTFVDKKRDVGHDQAEEYFSLYLVIPMDQILIYTWTLCNFLYQFMHQRINMDFLLFWVRCKYNENYNLRDLEGLWIYFPNIYKN